MNTTSEVDHKIIRKQQFLVMGTLTRIKPGTESGEKFASIWSEFEAYDERIKPHSTDQMHYGVSFPAIDGVCIDYVAGMAVMPVQTIPYGLVVRKVPANTYTVFACPVPGIGQTYQYIFGEWRFKSNCQIDNSAPAFEQYPPASDAETHVLIHIPIREKHMK